MPVASQQERKMRVLIQKKQCGLMVYVNKEYDLVVTPGTAARQFVFSGTPVFNKPAKFYVTTRLKPSFASSELYGWEVESCVRQIGRWPSLSHQDATPAEGWHEVLAS